MVNYATYNEDVGVLEVDQARKENWVINPDISGNTESSFGVVNLKMPKSSFFELKE